MTDLRSKADRVPRLRKRLRRLMGRALLAANGWRVREMQQWQRDPFSFQERLLRKLVRTAADTQFGRQHDFKAIRSVADYQERVPLRSYLDFKPYWDRHLDGQANVTWPGRVRCFAMTAGTTAGRKFIPLTRPAIRSQLRVGGDIRHFYVAQTGDLDVFCGKSLSLCGDARFGPPPHRVLSGDISAVTLECTPRYLRQLCLPKPGLARMADWEAKLNAMAEVSADADVRTVSGLPSRLLYLFDQLARRYRQAGRKADTFADIWPNLSLFMHGGVNFEPYRAPFQKLFGKTVHTIETYAASEGFIAIQDRLDANDLLLMMNTGIFYEFVPVEEIEAPRPRRFTVADVEKNVEYAVVLSTRSGLWAYRLGDTVRFVSLRPHRIRVTGRTEQFLNIAGEHLIVAEAETAVADTCRRTGAEIKDFHVAPIFSTTQEARPGYEWFIEFLKAPSDLARFAVLLDQSLQRQNHLYARFRKNDVATRPPQLELLPAGAFDRAMRQRGKISAQSKVPRLKDNREFACLLHATE